LLTKKPTNLKETFQSEPIEDICWTNWKRKRLVLIGEERLAERALSRINSHNISCLPVISSEGFVIGKVDILSIVSSLVNFLDVSTKQTFQKSMREFMSQPVRSLMSKQSYAISSSTSMLLACEHMLSLEESSFVVIRRKIEGDVTLLLKESDVVGIVTLSDILKFLVQNSMLMKQTPTFMKSIDELGLGRNPPKCASLNSNVWEAFKEIGRTCCGGLAVVDDNGLLVGNLSASDFKGLTRNNISILNSTIEKFLASDLKKPWWNRPICVDLNESLYHTIQQFASLGVHRMYVVENGKPIGEITHRDVLAQIYKDFQ